MKYTKGTQTLLGPIVAVEKYPNVKPYKITTSQDLVWLTESEIDKIVVKPKRNIDHLIELWESEKFNEACGFICDSLGWSNSKMLYDFTFDFFKPYIEPRKYPVLTPDELKTVKWLVDRGFETIFRGRVIMGRRIIAVNPMCSIAFCEIGIGKVLTNASWITETPIDLKELIAAQEGV